MDLKTKTYQQLLIWANPEPVTEKNYERLLAKVERLMREGGSSPKGAIRKIGGLLAELLEAYEIRTHGRPHVSGRTLLAHIVENRGESRAAFARAMGLRPQVISNVLNGKREISKKVAQRLSERLGSIDAMVFLVPDAESPPDLESLKWEAASRP